MKIIHISHIPDPTNGIFTVLMALSDEQKKLGHNVSVFNLCNGDACNEKIQHANSRKLIDKFVTDKPDIVIFHGVFYYEIYTISRALIRLGIPYLIEMHGSLSLQNMKKSRLKKVIVRRIFLDNVVRRAAAVIYLNDNELTNSAMLRVNPKAIVIPNGCYISNIKAEPVETAGPGKVEILFLGRIDVNHKGLDLLLPAVKKLYNGDMRDKIHFSFYGSGEDSDTAWLKKEVAGMEGFADFYGPVYGEAKNRVYQNSDLMVLTSRYEGFPMVILESLSHGTPCLVTPDTNVADIMQENDCGWVAEFDSDKIADTLNYAISDIEARKDLIRSNALNTGLQYKWNHIAEISIDRYKEILKNSHSI